MSGTKLNMASLMVTGACNLRCRMCDTGQAYLNPTDAFDLQRYAMLMSNEDKNLSLEQWERVVAEIQEMNPSAAVNISGGEPLLYKHIIKLMQIILDAGLRLRLVTNGVLLQHYSQKLLDLAENHAFEMSVSIDGSESIHDQVRGVKGCYSKTISGIHSLGPLRTRLGLKLDVTTTICDLNHPNLLEGIKANCDALSGHVRRYNIYHPWYRTEDVANHQSSLCPAYPALPANVHGMNLESINTAILGKQLRAIRETAQNLKEDIRIFPNISEEDLETYYTDSWHPIDRRDCMAPFTKLAITSCGDVLVNAICFAGKLGSIQKESLNSVWTGASLSNFRKLVEGQKMPGCYRCCDYFHGRPS